jgi:hypothetical protein
VSDIGYESRLIVGEVFGNRHGMPDDPAPMWMNPVVTIDLSKMGHDTRFDKLHREAKFAGVFVYRHARFNANEQEALEMAIQVIGTHAPEGSFELDVQWWKTLKAMPDDGGVEGREHEDSYGMPFKRLSIRQAAAAARADFEEDERKGKGTGYRRALLAATTLEHFVTAIDEGRWQEYHPDKQGIEPLGQLMLVHEGY